MSTGKAKGSGLEMCKALLEEFRVATGMFQMVKTRVFFRAGVLGHLEDTWARIQRYCFQQSMLCKAEPNCENVRHQVRRVDECTHTMHVACYAVLCTPTPCSEAVKLLILMLIVYH